jgi:hypothetical protein
LAAVEHHVQRRQLTSGSHVIRVDCFEDGADARANVDYRRVGEVVSADPGYHAEYYANQDLGGSPVLTRQDAAVDFAWGAGTPGDGVPVDHFSAKWNKSVMLPAGVHAFTVRSDDEARLFVDGKLLLNHWINQGPTT